MAMPPSLVPLSKIRNNFHCTSCNIEHMLGLLPNGDFGLCGIALTCPELVFGNFKTCRLKDIWNEHLTIRTLSKGIPDELEGVCRECVLKNICRGDCRAMAYADRGSVLAPYPLCQWARDNARFPSSRLVTV
jgi:radical SAM protein with 4Fe4S-binding SPASM domain